jgi:hypothetical protein
MNDDAASGQHGVEAKFLKSRLNAGTEAKAHDFVLQDVRFQKPTRDTKKRILELLGLDRGAWSAQSFDLIMLTPAVGNDIDIHNVDRYIDRITLVEVKSTRSPTVRDARLNGFFYGSSKTQYDLAEAAGDRLVFVFVVLTDTNRYGKPFFAVVPFPELEHRTRTKRVQYQVNLRSDMADQGSIQGPFPLMPDGA